MKDETLIIKAMDLGDGRKRLECPKGLWAVEGPEKEVVKEAIRYFIQYLEDGEYNYLLEKN